MRAFFDTNVLIYALAASADDPRCGIAQQTLARHAAEGSLVISTQVLLETFHVLTRKHRADAADALSAVRLMTRHEVVVPGVDAVLRALALGSQHRLSTWDALIVQAALDARCGTLYSEDLQAGRRFGDLEVVNPFALGVQQPAAVFAAAAPPAAPRRGPRRR